MRLGNRRPAKALIGLTLTGALLAGGGVAANASVSEPDATVGALAPSAPITSVVIAEDSPSAAHDTWFDVPVSELTGDLLAARVETLGGDEEQQRKAREAAGKYYSYCITPSGQTFEWTNNSATTCTGWLDTYISGQQVGHVNISGKYGPSFSCIATVGLNMVELFAGTLALGWSSLAGLAIWGLGCLGY